MSATLAVLIAGGIVVGLLLGLTGGGGSILTVPLLVYVVGLEAKVAIATSLVIVGAASLAGLFIQCRRGHVEWRTGLLFGIAGMLGAYGGGRVAAYFADIVLLLLFAGIMVASSLAMLRKKEPHAVATTSGSRPIARIVADGLVVGLVTGLVGAGGGFLVVPALVLLGGLSMRSAIGTSLLVISMKCFAGLAGYLSHVEIDYQAALVVGGLAAVGTLTGSYLTRFVSAPALRTGFAVFVLGAALALIYAELRVAVGEIMPATVFAAALLGTFVSVLYAALRKPRTALSGSITS